MPYSAPENYRPQEHYDYKNDVFSFGVILHYLLTSRYPFYFYSEK
jgi:serine/threonine protein kinase